jgi:hypothetical protein
MARLISPKETGRIRDSSGTRRFGIHPKPPTLSSIHVTIAATISEHHINIYIKIPCPSTVVVPAI